MRGGLGRGEYYRQRKQNNYKVIVYSCFDISFIRGELDLVEIALNLRLFSNCSVFSAS